MQTKATFTYKGKTYALADQQTWASTPIETFMREWSNSEGHVWGHTSGSTGEPKRIMLPKAAMTASAQLTNQHFGLKENDTILLCLSTDYIAGKMVVVRAIVGNLRIVIADVKSLPEWDDQIKFAALVPMQVEALLHTDSKSRERLKGIDTLIIGGSPLNQELQDELTALGMSNAYLTYGMTETLSHVAVARIGEGELTYKALKGITFETDERDCLKINAQHIQQAPFVTNDVVELLNSTSFRWKGRWDNVVNSGGIKLFPEKIEKKISDLFPDRRFYLKGEPDKRLGSCLVLKIEGSPLAEDEEKELLDAIKKRVEKYESPKSVTYLEKFEETTTGKTKRT